MREIKFRAWDKEERKMLYIGVSISDLAKVELRDVDTLIWLQYTGLKDKCGQEIYDKDIVRLFVPKVETEEGKEIIIKENFVVEYKKSGYSNILEQTKIVEIIGNIYENPELLKIK